MNSEMMSFENHSYRIKIAIGFAIPITCVAVFLRLLARHVQRLALGADDYVIVLGAGFTIGHAVVYIITSRYASGRHIASLQPATVVKYLKGNYIAQQLYGLSVSCIRLSILLFYRRIFTTTQFRRWTNFFAALVVIWLIGHAFGFLFQCRPVGKAWESEIPGHCISPINLSIGFLTTNVVLDVSLLALPVSVVWRLQLSRAKKFSVAGIFFLGGLSIIPCIIRLVALLTADLEDVTWETSLFSWGLLEPAVQVLCVCLPSMAPFLHGRKLRTGISALTRSVLSHTRSSKSGNGPKSHNMDRFGENPVPDNSQWTSVAATDNDFPAITPIPLQSIVVQQGLEPR